MRRYVGYALVLVAAATLLVWGVSQFVQPILPPEISSAAVLFFAALLSVTGFLAAFKDTVQLVQRLTGRTTQSDRKTITITHHFPDSGKQSPGILEVSAIQVKPNFKDKACTLDFRVSNTGGSEVIINRIEFEALEVAGFYTLGAVEFSKVYDLDISDLRNAGDLAACAVSQVVAPGKVDRFGITLIAPTLGIGWFRGWSLQPTLYTNYGNVTGQKIEVWLPFALHDASIEKTRKAIDRLRAQSREDVIGRMIWYSAKDRQSET
jgi:hypothetical protein